MIGFIYKRTLQHEGQRFNSQNYRLSDEGT